MSYKIPLKQTEMKAKWITITLIGLYVAIAALVFLNN